MRNATISSSVSGPAASSHVPNRRHCGRRRKYRAASGKPITGAPMAST